MNPYYAVWLTSGSLLLIGLAAVILRRQLLAMVFGLELMINAANVNFVYYARFWNDAGGLAAALLVMAVAAAEVVVGLCLLILLDRSGGACETGEIKELSG